MDSAEGPSHWEREVTWRPIPPVVPVSASGHPVPSDNQRWQGTKFQIYRRIFQIKPPFVGHLALKCLIIRGQMAQASDFAQVSWAACCSLESRPGEPVTNFSSTTLGTGQKTWEPTGWCPSIVSWLINPINDSYCISMYTYIHIYISISIYYIYIYIYIFFTYIYIYISTINNI